MVAENTFREDLYYRLNVMAIVIPPLRERDGDMETLANKLLLKVSDDLGKYMSTISQEAMAYLKAYEWPGNVRELENVLERAINLADSDTILPVHLPYSVTHYNVRKKNKTGSLKQVIEEEKEMIFNIMKETNGNKLKTARRLDISRSSLYDKLEKYGIE